MIVPLAAKLSPESTETGEPFNSKMPSKGAPSRKLKDRPSVSRSIFSRG